MVVSHWNGSLPQLTAHADWAGHIHYLVRNYTYGEQPVRFPYDVSRAPTNGNGSCQRWGLIGGGERTRAAQGLYPINRFPNSSVPVE
jgi:hypothetical protein